MSDISRKRQLLCEGYDPALVPEVIYVQQVQDGATKVCFLHGSRALCESPEFPDGTTVVESIDDLELVETLDEKTGRTTKHVKDGRWVVEGPFQRSDTKNANGRTYPRAIWDKHIADAKSAVQQSVHEGGMLGHLEHPKDGRTDGNLGALVTRDLTLRSDGVVWGIAELLDTSGGLILQEYTRKGVKWGVSSRGNGSVDDTGRVNENDYALTAFDGVMRPSTPGAFPTPVGASQREHANEDPEVTEDTEAPVVASAAAAPEPGTAWVDETTEDDFPHLTEAAADAQAAITALCETDCTEMDTSDRLAFAGELIDSLSRVDSLEGHTLPAAEAAALRDWLTKTLKATHESWEAEATVAAAVEDVGAADGDKAEQAFRHVVASLQARLDDAVQESAALRDRLRVTARAKTALEAAAKAKIAQAYAARDAAQAEAQAMVDTVNAELAAATDALRQTEAELAVANDLVSDTSTVEVRDPVEDAVAAALDANPALGEFADVLRNAPSAERVPALVERLESVVAARTSAVPVTRRALPSGRLVESEANAGSSRPTAPASRGARMAGAAIRQMSEGRSAESRV